MRLSPAILLILCPLATGGAAHWLRVRGGSPANAQPQQTAPALPEKTDAAERIVEKLTLPPLPEIDASIPESQAEAEMAALLAEKSAGKIRLRLARLPVPVLFAIIPLLEPLAHPTPQQARLRIFVLETALARDSRGTLELLAGCGVDGVVGSGRHGEAGDALLIESLRDPEWAATLFPDSTEWHFMALAEASPEAATRYAAALPGEHLKALFEGSSYMQTLVRLAPELVREKMQDGEFRSAGAIQEYGAALFLQDRSAFVSFLSGLNAEERSTFWYKQSDSTTGFPGANAGAMLDIFTQNPLWVKEMTGNSHSLLVATAGALWATDPDAAARCIRLAPASDHCGIWCSVAHEVAGGAGGIEAALRLAEQAPPDLRDSVRDGLLSRLAETDPARAVSLFSSDVTRDDGYMVIQRFCGKSPKEAAAWWASLPPERRTAIRDSWRGVTGMEPGTHSMAEISTFLAALNDPELAAAQTEEMLGSIAGGRGEAAALQWAKSLPDPALREQALAQALERTAARDPARAAEQWSTLPASDALASRAGNIAAQWAILDPAAAITWAGSLRGAARKEAVQRALMAAADTNPESVAEVLPAWTADAGVDGDEIRNYVAGRWATADAAAAAQWAQALPPGPQRDATLLVVLKDWATANPAGATAALATMTPGKTQDAAIGEVADTLPLTECVSWLCRISDPLVRREKLQLELRSEFMNHRAEVRSMLAPAAQNAIPEADRAILRSILPVDP